MWKLKYAGVSYKTVWAILDKAKPCSLALKKCSLFLAENYFILSDKFLLSNKRSEIFVTGPHRLKTPTTKLGLLP